MQHRSRFARRLCVAVDAEGYGSRDGVDQYDLQADLPSLLGKAAIAANLDRDAWEKQEQGDGELALVPADQPEPRLIDDFIRELAAELRLRNHNRTPAGRLRLRVAIAFGVAFAAPSGFAGGGVVATSRLLSSSCLHQALAEADYADLAVALSSEVYQTVVDRHTSLTPDQFTRAEVREKEYAGDAWIRTLPVTRTASSGRPPGGNSAAPPAPNNFYAPVDVGVIGVNLGSVNKGRP